MCCDIEMPKYKCNKIVHALKIKDISIIPVVPSTDNKTNEKVKSGSYARITPEDKKYGKFSVGEEYFKKHNPKAGGYYVVYKGGYESWSPAKAFEDGYNRI